MDHLKGQINFKRGFYLGISSYSFLWSKILMPKVVTCTYCFRGCILNNFFMNKYVVDKLHLQRTTMMCTFVVIYTHDNDIYTQYDIIFNIHTHIHVCTYVFVIHILEKIVGLVDSYHINGLVLFCSVF